MCLNSLLEEFTVFKEVELNKLYKYTIILQMFYKCVYLC